MSNSIPENRILPQMTQASASGAQQTTVPQAPKAEPVLFEANAVNSNSSLDELYAQRDGVNANITTLNQNEGTAELTLEQLTEIATKATEAIAKATEANEILAAQNVQLNNDIRTSVARIGEINTRTREIKAQIDQCSGFTGTLINGLKSIIGKGVDVNALRTELASLEAEKQEHIQANKERRAQIEANNGQVDENLAEIETNDGYVQDAEAQKAQTEIDLKEIQAGIVQGAITLTDVEENIREAVENQNKPVEGSEANNEGDVLAETLGTEVSDIAQGSAEGTITENTQLSDEQITGAATTFVDMAVNGELTADTMDSFQEGIAAQDPSTGEFDAEAFKPAYEAAGFAPEEIGIRIDIVEALTSYAEMGLNIDAQMLETTSVVQLDEMIETAMVQDTIKATSTKVVGKGAIITSKKEMQKNAESVDDFIDTFSALNNYYQANDVENLEVKAFLNLSNDKINKINNGYVYGTSELQEMTNNAGAMMTTLRTAISLDEAAGESASIQFEDNKHKADDAINNAESKLGENEDTSSIDEFRAEFLNLTSKFNNSESDSAKQVSIKAMETLYQRALNADNGVDKDPYKSQFKIAA